jgi:hypothetical protein
MKKMYTKPKFKKKIPATNPTRFQQCLLYASFYNTSKYGPIYTNVCCAFLRQRLVAQSGVRCRTNNFRPEVK